MEEWSHSNSKRFSGKFSSINMKLSEKWDITAFIS